MINNPFFLDLYMSMGQARIVEVIPIYEERNKVFLPTGNFRLYAGYVPDNELPYPDADALREQYFDNLDLMGDDNPCFLGRYTLLASRILSGATWVVASMRRKFYRL